MSSLVPGLFAVFQSIGVKDECEYFYSNSTFSNMTLSTTPTSISTPIQRSFQLKSNKLVPNYSVTIYFIIMFVLLFVSASAFSYLHFSATARKARKSNSSRTEDIAMSRLELIQSELDYKTDKSKLARRKALLLFLTFSGSFIQYGYLPGLLSYSTIPYGNFYFHLSINLSKLFDQEKRILSEYWIVEKGRRSWRFKDIIDYFGQKVKHGKKFIYWSRLKSYGKWVYGSNRPILIFSFVLCFTLKICFIYIYYIHKRVCIAYLNIRKILRVKHFDSVCLKNHTTKVPLHG